MHKKKLIGILLIAAAVVAVALIIVLVFHLNAPAPSSPTTPPTQANAALQPTPTQAVVIADDVSLSAEQLVTLYFQQFNSKSPAGMDACLIAADRGGDYELQHIASVDLQRCVEQQGADATASFNPVWYANPADIALVIVDCTIHFNDAGKEAYQANEMQRTDYKFWLVRELPGTGWRIAAQGV